MTTRRPAPLPRLHRTPAARWCAGAALCGAALLAGCASHLAEVSPAGVADAVFTDSDTFARTYDAPPERSCEAARRALLSQAYLITDGSERRLSARKSFQRSREQHYEIEFHVTCVANPNATSTVFVSAVQQLYGLRKTNSSASVGVGIFGSLSVPIKSEDDSLVKIGSVTLTRPGLYDRFFELVQGNLLTLEYRSAPPDAGAPLDPGLPDSPLQPEPAAPALSAPVAP